MIIKSFFLLFLPFLLSATALNAQSGSVSVTISGIEAAGKGKMVFMLFADDEGFPKEVGSAAYRGIVTAFGTTASYAFDNLPAGEYALAVFQDLDGNEEIETNFIGIPREPIVASNMMRMGKPSYRKSTFRVEGGRVDISLKLLNQ